MCGAERSRKQILWNANVHLMLVRSNIKGLREIVWLATWSGTIAFCTAQFDLLPKWPTCELCPNESCIQLRVKSSRSPQLCAPRGCARERFNVSGSATQCGIRERVCRVRVRTCRGAIFFVFTEDLCHIMPSVLPLDSLRAAHCLIRIRRPHSGSLPALRRMPHSPILNSSHPPLGLHN